MAIMIIIPTWIIVDEVLKYYKRKGLDK